MEHIITTYGGGELFFLIFNGISALFNQEGGILIPMIHLGLMVGSVYVVVIMIVLHRPIEGIRWLLWVIVATNLLFLPKTKIHIHDPLNTYHREIEHVPLVLGIVASTTSNLGKIITEKLESVFTLPDYLPYHKTGTVFASSLIRQLGQFRIIDPGFKGNMERFVNQCVVYDSMIGQKYSLSDLHHSSNIWELVTSHTSPVLGFLYKEGKDPGTIVSCRDGAKKLEELWTDEIKRATALYGTRIQNRILTETAFNTDLMSSARLLSNAAHWADSAQNIIRQEMMIHALEDGSQNRLSELGSASSYAATKAILQQRSAYEAAGTIAAQTLPLFKNVIEALSYALFIFVVVLALLPNGHRILCTYCGILIWTQLWAPLYAVLNLIMTLYGRTETIARGANHGLTFLNSNAIINANADMTTLAAWLSVSIPFISYGILRQGAGAFVGLAQYLGSAMQSSASSAATETVSGNISLGNVTLGTQTYQNTTAFQHLTSPSYNDSEFKATSGSGVEQSTFSSGIQSLSDHGLSLTPVTLMANINTSYELQQRLNNAQSLMETKSTAFGKSMEEASQKTSSLLNRLGSDISSHESFSHSLSSTESEALQNHQSLVKEISQSLNVSKATANDLAVHIKAGIPDYFPVSLNASDSLSSSMTNQEALQKAQNISQQSGHTYNLDTLVSAAKTLMQGRNDTQGIELAHSAGASLIETQHLREEASFAETRMKELSSALSSSQRQDFQESRNITQEFLEFVANQPVNRGPSEGMESQSLGMMGALSILKSGGPEYTSYLNRFKEAHPQYTIRSIGETPLEQETSFSPKANSLVEAHQTQITALTEKGKNLGLQSESPNSLAAAHLQDLETTLLAATTNIKTRKKSLDLQVSAGQKSIDLASQENVILGNLGYAAENSINAGQQILKTLDEFASSRTPTSSSDPLPAHTTEKRTIGSEKDIFQKKK